MSDVVYHGSTVDIHDAYLKPLGASVHLNQENALYLTESKSLAVNYALFWRSRPDEVRDLSYFDNSDNTWKTVVVVKSPEVLKGYIYETARPTSSPVRYFDQKNNDFITEYQPDAKAVFAVTDEVKILGKQLIDYNYLKANPLPFPVAVVNKKHTFEQATAEIQKKLQELSNSSTKDSAEIANRVKQILAAYTNN